MTEISTLPRPDYPRPQFQRGTWLNLNGAWEFEFDDERIGDLESWTHGKSFSRIIQVPFCFQSALSGIQDTDFHDQVWYRKIVQLPDEYEDKRILLHFGAVDYEAWVWINGSMAVYHEGGHTPFSADITPYLKGNHAEIVVKVRDYSRDLTLPRGKQFWKAKSESIWYTRTTGIWQTVWIEAVSDTYLRSVKFTPDIDTDEIQLRASVEGDLANQDVRLCTRIRFNNEWVAEESRKIRQGETTFRIGLNDFSDHGMGRLWSPEHPNLYDVQFTLLINGQTADQVESYFGMRKISVIDGRLCLNNRPYFMRLVLDQGYFPDGVLTPPSDEAVKRDVELTKELGFNGARKHQKVEDPRYAYWCDKLGLLVWGEMANAQHFNETYARRFVKEWQEAVERDYNHPCIVAWVPLNESWGVNSILTDAKEQQHALAMYHFTKSIDPTRPVISNDGWEHVKSDLCTIHDYAYKREVLEKRYSNAESAVTAKPARRWIHVPGFPYEGEPILVSEYGGISYKKSEWEGWGYSAATNDEDFIERYKAVTQPLLESPVVQGFCYTQLTDVEQEINGLLTYDREPKVPLEAIRAVNEGRQG